MVDGAVGLSNVVPVLGQTLAWMAAAVAVAVAKAGDDESGRDCLGHWKPSDYPLGRLIAADAVVAVAG